MEVRDSEAVTESRVDANGARFFTRVVGKGFPAFVVHGGPDLDHSYLLPGLDDLGEICELHYYDQRGRGRSSGEASEVTMANDVEDLEGLRRHFKHEKIALIGHSWGGLIALEYALRFSDNVSHLILMNSAPPSFNGMQQTRTVRLERLKEWQTELEAISQSKEFQSGNPKAWTDLYAIKFRSGFKNPEDVTMLDLHLDRWEAEGILRGQAIEDRLWSETYDLPDYDLTPQLGQLSAPTLVVHGDYDFVPIQCARDLANAIPGAQFKLIQDSGHFSYLDQPAALAKILAEFLNANPTL